MTITPTTTVTAIDHLLLPHIDTQLCTLLPAFTAKRQLIQIPPPEHIHQTSPTPKEQGKFGECQSNLLKVLLEDVPDSLVSRGHCPLHRDSPGGSLTHDNWQRQVSFCVAYGWMMNFIQELSNQQQAPNNFPSVGPLAPLNSEAV